MDQVIRAALFAAKKHQEQRRKDQEASPYINHPLGVADVLCNEGGGIDPMDTNTLMAALLHDTIEDTATTIQELSDEFGEAVAKIVLEVSDDKSLPKAERKNLQIVHASSLSREAKLVKLADKICNLRDMAQSPPLDWSLERKIEYFEWSKAVVDQLRGVHAGLEALFDQAYQAHP